MGQISKATGIKRQSVAKILKQLKDKNIIGVLPKKLTGVTQKANTLPNYITFSKDYDKWRVLPKKLTGVTQKANRGVSQNASHKRNKNKDIHILSDNKKFITYAYETFKTQFKKPLCIDGGKDGKIIKGLLGTYTYEEIKSLWDVFLSIDDSFINTAGRSIGVFKSQINKLVSISNKPDKNAWRM